MNMAMNAWEYFLGSPPMAFAPMEKRRVKPIISPVTSIVVSLLRDEIGLVVQRDGLGASIIPR